MRATNRRRRQTRVPGFGASRPPALFRLLTPALLTLLAAALPAQSVSVMSYNLRLDTPADGEHAWPKRRDALAAQVAWYAPDVMGVQEALPRQLDYLRSRLHGYDFVGEPRRDGDEASAIFYRRDRFEVVGTHTFWLSPTPDEVSTGWGASYPRIATYARLRERATAREFLVVNTHLDHESAEARERGLALIADVVDSVAGPSLPVVLTGDFNAEPGSAVLSQLSDRYLDAFAAAEGPRIGPAGTFSGFDARELPERRIDYVLVRRHPRVRVESFATLADPRGHTHLSDHLPVMARLRLSPKPITIGHRGARGHAAENSLASVQAALDLGVDMMEVDVFRLRDGEIVVFHDARLARLTDGDGGIEDLTLAELNQLTLLGAHKVPRLRDVLTLIDHRTRLNVELKGANTAEGTHAVLAEFVERHGYKWEDFTISSFRHDELRRMRQLDADIEIGILPTGPAIEALAVGEELGAHSINPSHKKLTQADVDAMHAAGFLVYPWTVNAPEDVARMIELGVDGLITDYPERVPGEAARR